MPLRVHDHGVSCGAAVWVTSLAAVLPVTLAVAADNVGNSVGAPRIRWNAGYQYYGYHEQFSTLRNYRAHGGYTSVSWSF